MENSLREMLPSCAEEFSTPCYVYSAEKIDAQCRSLKEAFHGTATDFCFAVKANNVGAILTRIFHQGFGADVVSGGELSRAIECGANPSKILFSGVGKQDWEIELGVKHQICFNVESPSELGRIHLIAESLRAKARILLRVNPGLPADTHPYIATGLYSSKFGIAENKLEEAIRLARSLPNLRLTGLACHLGSQITDVSIFENASRRLVNLVTQARQGHPEMDSVDLGGGLAVRYTKENPPSPEIYAQAILKPLAGSGLKLFLEPGRWIVAESGGLLCQVITVKTSPEKTFVVVDGGMNDLLRPSLYEAVHPIEPVSPRAGSLQKVDIVGPICETGDFLGLDRTLPPLEAGDLIWVGVAGAYGSSMSSNYNSRPRAAEVLLENGHRKQIRRRQTLEELKSCDLS
jgi:diaminopimelate decarboxylase